MKHLLGILALGLILIMADLSDAGPFGRRRGGGGCGGGGCGGGGCSGGQCGNNQGGNNQNRGQQQVSLVPGTQQQGGNIQQAVLPSGQTITVQRNTNGTWSQVPTNLR